MSNSDFEALPPQKDIIDLTHLPDEQRQLVNWIIRQQKVTLSDIVNNQNISEQLAQQYIENLISHGFIRVVKEEEAIYYQPHFASPKKSRLPQHIWDKLET
ncbi:MAG TPA: MarR family transcriptional regulator [Trichormus sp. M33_DOE_039]|nr:MarR family transcriptional regulator [Trichormus sp. M33_DOE_039]